MTIRKFISIGLSAITVATAFTACAPSADQLDPAITLASSAARTNAEWLDERLETIPDDVVIGLGSNEDYGIDMSDFEDDGYIARSINGEVFLFGKTEEGLDRAVREYAKAADVGATAELDTVYHEGARIKKLTVADRDISEYTIIHNHDRDAKFNGNAAPTLGNAHFASQELQRLILQATGIELQIKTFDDKVSGPVISIDYYTGDDLGENGFTYKVENGNIYIKGVGKANGCANAVYYLLQHECGWDALLYGDSDLQPSEHLDIPNGVEKKVKPMFDWFYMRHMYYDDFDTDKDSRSHTYLGSAPKASHSLGRWSGAGNICPTDEGIYTHILDNILYYLDASVNSGKTIGEDLVAIDLGMDDEVYFCQCRNCLVVFREENKTIIGASVRMTNSLATDIADAGFEGLIYTIYAYAGLNVPCVTKPLENVYITYCMNGSCVNHPFEGSDCSEDSYPAMGNIIRNSDGDNKEYKEVNNADFAKWMQGWGELAEHVYLYYYLLPANFSQYSYLRQLYDDVHFAYEAGLEGFQPEAQYMGLGLNRLRFQLIMDIIWHPEMTKEEFEMRLDEHMRREYGDGFTYVQDHIGIWEKTEINTGCWSSWLYVSLISTDTFEMDKYAARATEMYALLEKALMQCNTAKQEERVKRLMVDVLYKECYTQYFEAYDTEDTEMIEYLEGRYNIFVQYMRDCGYSFENNASTWSFGPSVRTGGWDNPNRHKPLMDTLEEAAWIDWMEWREDLTVEGVEPKPMPNEYEEYWETAETE